MFPFGNGSVDSNKLKIQLRYIKEKNKLFKNKYFKILIKVFISGVILTILFVENDLSIIYKEFISTDYIKIIFALLFIVLGWCFQTLRYHLIINNYKNFFSYSESYKLILIGDALNVLLPAGAGEIMKSHYAYLKVGEPEYMYTSSFIEKAYAVHSIILVALLPLWVKGYTTIFYCCIVLWSILTYLLFADKGVSTWIKKLPIFSKKSKNNILLAIGISFKMKIYCILISIALWICTMTGFYFLFLASAIPISVNAIYYTFPIVVIARLFPFTLNGLGIQEAIMVVLLKDYGIEAEQSIALGFQFRLLNYILPALLGVIIILFNKNKESMILTKENGHL